MIPEFKNKDAFVLTAANVSCVGLLSPTQELKVNKLFMSKPYPLYTETPNSLSDANAVTNERQLIFL